MTIFLVLLTIYFLAPIIMLLFWDRCFAYALTPWEAFKFIFFWPILLMGE